MRGEIGGERARVAGIATTRVGTQNPGDLPSAIEICDRICARHVAGADRPEDS
jgi:hypothetical protein